MTPEEIAKLPNPETDAEQFTAHDGWIEGGTVLVDVETCRYLEQRLAAAVMALELALMQRTTGDYLQDEEEAIETLASLKASK